MSKTQAISFWKFLTQHKIEIPIIQRDYAQGRKGKEELRSSFLANIKQALDGQLPNGEILLKLDFVYGSLNYDTLNPLDGQQRLTTLWLLHWYIALRAGKLDEASNTLRRFSYETRITSRDFCEQLCTPNNFPLTQVVDIVGFIEKQTWFYSTWKQDPTIQSMMRMLRGTHTIDKQGIDFIDGVEELFKHPINEVGCIYQKYWGILTSEQCPILFYYLPLEKFGLSDDLYIKMNARGKQLTSFENFKADLIGLISEHAKVNSEWQRLLDPQDGFPIKIDTTWTDIFWKNKSTDMKIDDIYFAFINRYFLQELICAKKTDQTGLFTVNQIEDNDTFKYLYGEKGDDSKLLYSSIVKYRYHNREIPLSLFCSLESTLNNYQLEPLNNYFPEWVQNNYDFEFIPKYEDQNIISTLGQKERVVFLAVSRYFSHKTFNETTFKQWMRIVWNIVENSNIDTIPTMIGTMRLIDELSEHSHDIYSFLAEEINVIQSDASKEQIKEERIKAQKIVENTSWEDHIITAENCKYLKGKIWVLFQDDEATTIETFKERYGLLDSILNDNDKYHLAKILISYYDKIYPQPAIELKKTDSNWKKLLTERKEGLFNCFRKITKNNICPNITYQWIKDIAETQLLNNSRENAKKVGKYGNKVVLWGTSGCKRYVFSNEVCGNVIIGNHRTLLTKSSSFQLQHVNTIIPNTLFIAGFNINFKYNDHFFQWWGTSNTTELDIYLMTNKWDEYEMRNPELDKYHTDQDKYYCFRLDKTPNIDNFTKQLDDLIAQKNEDEKMKET